MSQVVPTELPYTASIVSTSLPSEGDKDVTGVRDDSRVIEITEFTENRGEAVENVPLADYDIVTLSDNAHTDPITSTSSPPTPEPRKRMVEVIRRRKPVAAADEPEFRKRRKPISAAVTEPHWKKPLSVTEESEIKITTPIKKQTRWRKPTTTTTTPEPSDESEYVSEDQSWEPPVEVIVVEEPWSSPEEKERLEWLDSDLEEKRDEWKAQTTSRSRSSSNTVEHTENPIWGPTNTIHFEHTTPREDDSPISEHRGDRSEIQEPVTVSEVDSDVLSFDLYEPPPVISARKRWRPSRYTEKKGEEVQIFDPQLVSLYPSKQESKEIEPEHEIRIEPDADMENKNEEVQVPVPPKVKKPPHIIRKSKPKQEQDQLENIKSPAFRQETTEKRRRTHLRTKTDSSSGSESPGYSGFENQSEQHLIEKRKQLMVNLLRPSMERHKSTDHSDAYTAESAPVTVRASRRRTPLRKTAS